MSHAKKLGKIAVNLLFYLFVIVLICFLPKLLRFFLPLVIGWLISMIANPLAKFMEKRMKIVRKYTSAMIIIASIGIVVVLCYLLVLLCIQIGSVLVDFFPSILKEVQGQIEQITNGSNTMFNRLPDGLEQTILSSMDTITASITEWAKGFATSFVGTVGDLASNLPNGLVVLIFTILSAYFFIADKNRLNEQVKRIFPASTIERYNYIVGQLKFAVGGYFKAQFQIMGIIMVILFIGFLILGIHPGISFLVAFATAFLDFVPFLGTGFVLGPWAVFCFFAGDYYQMIGMGILYIICLVTHQLVQPKLIGDSIGLDAFRTLIFMWIGYRMGNVLGMIIGIPVGMILINLYDNGVFDGVKKTFYELGEEIKILRKW